VKIDVFSVRVTEKCSAHWSTIYIRKMDEQKILYIFMLVYG